MLWSYKTSTAREIMEEIDLPSTLVPLCSHRKLYTLHKVPEVGPGFDTIRTYGI